MVAHPMYVLCQGLQNHQRLKIKYHGEERVVEVHAVGISPKGNSVVRVFQVIGGAVFGANSGWKMLKIEDIEDIEPIGEFYTGPREGYSPGDRGMTSILMEM